MAESSIEGIGMSYKVSIIVPIYNVEAYIERCARSLFEQSFESIEYIFVNDCTKDRSMEILQQVMQEYPKRVDDVKICSHKTNQGQAATRNTGLSAASGEYTIQCDSDDWTDIDMISVMYKQAIATHADIVWCDYYVSFSNYNEQVRTQMKEDSLSCIKSFLTAKVRIHLWNLLVKRELYTKNNIFFLEGANLGEDLRVVIQLFYFAKTVSYCPQNLYYYVQTNPSAITKLNWEGQLSGLLSNTEDILTFLKKHGLDKALPVETNILKLEAKRALLGSKHKQDFLRWRNIYPEANKYIWKWTVSPLYVRAIGWCVARKELDFIIILFLFLKRIKSHHLS
jgi:glycosyltransferase involved in cell wall biosynthesis